MTSSLIPERPLLISPTLAATIGLEEAVLLHVISELIPRFPQQIRAARRWVELPFAELTAALPFWDEADLRRIQHNLLEKGVILMEAAGPECQRIAINERCEQEQPQASRAARATPIQAAPSAAERVFQAPSTGRASVIAPDWWPGDELFQQCMMHQIPREFVEQRVRGFVMYQRDRGTTQYSWHHTFLKYILREWRQEQSQRGSRELASDMSADWRPGEDALAILEHAGIPRDFIEDAVPEFVLYWRERGVITSTWNTRFIGHVRRQWAKFSAEVEQDATPRPIPTDYEPSAACFEVLAMANIDEDFARRQLREFILYWQDRGEACESWNTRFLQHVKYRWANRGNSPPAQQQTQQAIERFTDRSWAE